MAVQLPNDGPYALPPEGEAHIRGNARDKLIWVATRRAGVAARTRVDDGLRRSVEMLRSLLAMSWLPVATRAQVLCSQATNFAMLGDFSEARAKLSEAEALAPEGVQLRSYVLQTRTKCSECEADALPEGDARKAALYTEAKLFVEQANALVDHSDNHNLYGRLQAKLHPYMDFVSVPSQGIGGGFARVREDAPVGGVTLAPLPPGPPPPPGERVWQSL